jgi:hypothetical protein
MSSGSTVASLNDAFSEPSVRVIAAATPIASAGSLPGRSKMVDKYLSGTFRCLAHAPGWMWIESFFEFLMVVVELASLVWRLAVSNSGFSRAYVLVIVLFVWLSSVGASTVGSQRCSVHPTSSAHMRKPRYSVSSCYHAPSIDAKRPG